MHSIHYICKLHYYVLLHCLTSEHAIRPTCSAWSAPSIGWQVMPGTLFNSAVRCNARLRFTRGEFFGMLQLFGNNPYLILQKKTNFNSTFDCNWSFLELCRLRNSDSNGTAINMSTLLPASHTHHTHQALLKTPREQSRKLVEGERWCNILKWPLRSQYHSLSFQPFPPLEWVKPLKPPRWYLVSMPFEGYPCKTQTKGLCPQPIQLQILWFLSQNSIYRKTIYAGVLFSKSSPGFAPLQCLKDVWRFLLIEFIGRLTFPAPSSPRTKGHFQVIFHSTNWNLWEYTDLNPLSSHLGDDISDFKKWYWYLIATELPIGTIF